MHIAVVGAGISGLTCAYELEKAGFSVDVFEKGPVGGRLLSDRRRGLTTDLGANFICPDTTWVPYYCKNLGVSMKRISWEPKKIVYKGKLLSFSPLQIARLNIRWLAVMGALIRYWKSCASPYNLNSSDPILDRGRADVFAKRLGSDFHDYIVNPIFEGLLFTQCRDNTRGFLLSAMKHILFVVGRSPYHFGGMDNLARAFAKQLHIRYREVTNVKPTNRGVTVSGSKFEKEYDLVVLACPQAKKFYTGTMLQQELLSGTKYSKTIVLGFRASSELLTNLSVVFAPSKENKVIAICTNEGRKMAKGNTCILGVALHSATATAWMKLSDKEIFRRVRAELPHVIPSLDTSQLQDHLVHRWEYALPKYTPEHVARVRKFWAHGQGDRGVYFCGDFMNAPLTEGSIICGRKVAAMIIKKFKPSD